MGACAALSDADKITAAYRGHGWVVEADILPPSVLSGICHRQSGFNGGRARSPGGDKMSNHTEVRHAAR